MANALRTIVGVKGTRTIKVTIFDNGTTKVETIGYGGATCLNDPVVKGLERSLGDVESIEKTKEFHQAATVTNPQKAGQ